MQRIQPAAPDLLTHIRLDQPDRVLGDPYGHDSPWDSFEPVTGWSTLQGTLGEITADRHDTAPGLWIIPLTCTDEPGHGRHVSTHYATASSMMGITPMGQDSLVVVGHEVVDGVGASAWSLPDMGLGC
ncbi:hypothetical protein GCM10007061_20740 [Kocuria marina]|nr:hypothetical protein GCM10007061_20740 [Kocuria marina]